MERQAIEACKNKHLVVRMLDGLQDYEPVWQAMKSFTDERDAETDDALWILQHKRVFTLGQAGKEHHLLAPGDIPVVKVDRGGQVTYHGPGQLVVYLMLDLKRMGIGPRELVSRIEQSIVNLLSHYGLEAYPRDDAPGVYIDNRKIASVGLRIRNGKSFHGLSLNVEMDMEPFSRINPCGYSELEMIQLSDFEGAEPLEQAAGRLVREIQTSFGYEDIIMEYAQDL